MKITKLGHCCLLVEEGGLRVLTDPGNLSEGLDAAKNIDLVLITHEHSDHFHLESLRAVLSANPQAKVITNSAVGALMKKENMTFELLEHGQLREDKGVKIEGVGTEHALFHSTISPVMNTGYCIGDGFFYPGDAFTLPERPVEILALPVAGPWMKIAEAIDYALELKPKVWFPVHDGILKKPEQGFKWSSKVLESAGLRGVALDQGREIDF